MTKFKCEHCKKSFKSAHGLKLHQTRSVACKALQPQGETMENLDEKIVNKEETCYNEDTPPITGNSVVKGASLSEVNRIAEEKHTSGLAPASLPPKKIGARSWRPASLTEVTGRDPNYTYRLVNTEIGGNVQKKLAEQWEICTEEQVNLPVKTLADGSKIGTTNQVRELLLMRMPNEVAESRRKYHQGKEVDATALKNDFKRNIGSYSDGGAYGNVTQETNQY